MSHTKVEIFLLFMNIQKKTKFRLGVTIKKSVLIKKVFKGMLNIFYIVCVKKFFLATPPPI